MTSWSFLTTHARVLLAIAGDRDIRLRDIATAVGVTERRAQEIVSDLAASGYVDKHRLGRRNRYEIQSARRMNDDLIDLTIGDVLDLLTRAGDARASKSSGDVRAS